MKPFGLEVFTCKRRAIGAVRHRTPMTYGTPCVIGCFAAGGLCGRELWRHSIDDWRGICYFLGSPYFAYQGRLLRRPTHPLAGIGKGEDRARIFHFGGYLSVFRSGNATGIGCNIDRPPVRAHSRVPKPVLRLEVARKMASGCLPVGTQWQDIERTTLEGRYEQNMVPTRNACPFRFVVLHAGNAYGRPANGFDALARRVCKVKPGCNCEHGRQWVDKRFPKG